MTHDLFKPNGPYQLIDWQRNENENYDYLTIADTDGEEVATITHRSDELSEWANELLIPTKVDQGRAIVDALNSTYAAPAQTIDPESLAKLNDADDFL